MKDSPDNNSIIATSMLSLSSEEEKEIMKLAAVGLMPVEIAMSMDWDRERRAMFCTLAQTPGSDVSFLIASGRASGKSAPQIKLQEAAAAGNIDAIKTLQKLQANNRFKELVNYMDEDEFSN